MSKPSLRELLRMSLVSTGTRLFFKAIIKELEALREFVESEDTPTDEEYNDARDDRIRSLQDALVEAQAEIERLRPLAENWGLVLGMRPGSSLTLGSGGGPYWTDINQAGKNIDVATSIDPAQALRAIQKEVGDAEA